MRGGGVGINWAPTFMASIEVENGTNDTRERNSI